VPNYFIEKIYIKNLWGRENISLHVHEDVNIIIGRNASGKTTILNLVYCALTADLVKLSQYAFEEIVIRLSGFSSKSRKTLRVTPVDEGFVFKIGKKSYDLNLKALNKRVFVGRNIRFELIQARKDLQDALRPLVPIVWLPVSRRIPVGLDRDEDEIGRARTLSTSSHSKMESVDVRLTDILERFKLYRVGLDAQLSDRYKDFEKNILGLILYQEDYDTFGKATFGGLTSDEQEQFVNAFKSAGLYDNKMESKIKSHFSAVDTTLKRLQEKVKKKEPVVDIDDFFIVPLISRTKSIIQYARDLEKKRENLFTPLTKYVEVINGFFNKKRISVGEDGELKVNFKSDKKEIDVFSLSSGEKQLLILLTEALLWENKPVVYIADEPELSLHVTWQERLVESLMSIGQNTQIIIATHSPDIVGPYKDKIIDIEHP
jgi:ABC-type lipoprotein export system ATPase subunit